MRNIAYLTALIGWASAALLATGQMAAAQCGPGNHWVDTCAAGADSMSTGALVGIDMNFDCCADLSLVFTGPITVQRTGPLDDSANFPGSAPVDTHLDVIDTEIVTMNMVNGGITLKAGLGQGGVIQRTLGTIVEIPGNPALANSFFDVFFEVRLPMGVLLYNQSPLRISVPTIDRVPPQTQYFHPQTCLALYTSPVPGSGTHMANLVTARHDTIPGSAGIPTMAEWMVIILGGTCLAIGAYYVSRRQSGGGGMQPA